MKKHITTVELSVYADGESREPTTVEAHLSACRTCQNALAAITKISHALSDLPAPDIHPAFARRILATLEEETAPRYARSMPWGLTFAGVAAMGLLVAGAILPSTMNRGNGSADNLALLATDVTSPTLELRDEATLLAEFDRVFSENRGAFTNVMLKAYAPVPAPDVLDDDFVVLALADNDVLNSVSDEWAVADDVRSVVNSMTKPETALFKQLLADSAHAESTGDAPHKG